MACDTATASVTHAKFQANCFNSQRENAKNDTDTHTHTHTHTQIRSDIHICIHTYIHIYKVFTKYQDDLGKLKVNL